MSEEIESFIRSFESCKLPVSQWTHGKHLTMALWYLRKYPRDEATQRIRDGIQRYNLNHGNRTGYHETITLAWIAVICEFLSERADDASLEDLARDLLNTCGQKDFLLRYYSRDRLFSEAARHGWVAPDRCPIETASATTDGGNEPKGEA